MAIDLNPLTKDVIEKMELSNHDLWVVKLADEVYGPYEAQALKQYATENEKSFVEAQATRLDTNDWRPFYSHALFHDIQHSEPEAPAPVIKYWVISKGQKAGPLSRMDVDKKLEMEILSLNDLVSTDEGHSWKKFFQLDEFNAHQTSSMDDLPASPTEASFQRAKVELAERMEDASPDEVQEGLIDLAHLGVAKKSIPLNLEEIDLKSLNETEVSRSLRWAIPSAVAAVAVLFFVGQALMSPSAPEEVAAVTEPQENLIPKTVTHRAPRRVTPPPAHRSPASYRPVEHHQRSALTAPPVIHSDPYPTQVENHHYEPDPMIDPVVDAEPPMPNNEPQEHSIVSNTLPGEANDSLDQAMGNAAAYDTTPPPEAPVIEEASDF